MCSTRRECLFADFEEAWIASGRIATTPPRAATQSTGRFVV